jgi:hypothetical protein
MEVQLHAFLNRALDGGEFFIPGKEPPVHVGKVGPRASLDAVAKRK